MFKILAVSITNGTDIEWKVKKWQLFSQIWWKTTVRTLNSMAIMRTKIIVMLASGQISIMKSSFNMKTECFIRRVNLLQGNCRNLKKQRLVVYSDWTYTVYYNTGCVQSGFSLLSWKQPTQLSQHINNLCFFKLRKFSSSKS